MEVTVTTLDEIVKVHQIQHLDFIKADIEGGELGMLMGGKREALQRFHPHISLKVQEWHTERFGYGRSVRFPFWVGIPCVRHQGWRGIDKKQRAAPSLRE